jgi:hypothetical protein
VDEAERCLFEEAFAEAIRPDNWRKVVRRGWALRRSTYDAVRGLHGRYGEFAVYLIAADLHRAGYRLAYAEDVKVTHVYAASLHKMDREIEVFARGECLYRLDTNPLESDPYFPAPPEWIAWQTLHPDAVQACMAALVAQARRGAAVRQWLRSLAHLARRGMLGRRGLLWQYETSVRLAKLGVKLSQAASPRHVLPTYRAYHRLQTSVSRLRFLADQSHAEQVVPGSNREYDLAALGAASLFGFHPPETDEGRGFRWSSETSAVRLKAQGPDHGLRLHLHPFVPDLPEGRFAVYLGGQRLVPCGWQDTTLELALPTPRQGLGDWLVILAPRLAAPDDPRRLGIPLARATLV